MMIRIPSLLSLAFFGLALLVPGAAAAKFECPSPLKPSAPATLAEIKDELPDRTAMADVGRLTATIDVLRREGLPKSRNHRSYYRRLLSDGRARRLAH